MSIHPTHPRQTCVGFTCEICKSSNLSSIVGTLLVRVLRSYAPHARVRFPGLRDYAPNVPGPSLDAYWTLLVRVLRSRAPHARVPFSAWASCGITHPMSLVPDRYPSQRACRRLPSPPFQTLGYQSRGLRLAQQAAEGAVAGLDALHLAGDERVARRPARQAAQATARRGVLLLDALKELGNFALAHLASLSKLTTFHFTVPPRMKRRK